MTKTNKKQSNRVYKNELKKVQNSLDKAGHACYNIVTVKGKDPYRKNEVIKMTKATLTGSPKQIAWAENLRRDIESMVEDKFEYYLKTAYIGMPTKRCEILRELLIKAAENLIENETSSKAYIENRGNGVRYILSNALTSIKCDSLEGASGLFIKKLEWLKEGYSNCGYYVIKFNGTHFIVKTNCDIIYIDFVDRIHKIGDRERLSLSASEEEKEGVLSEILRRL